MRPEFCVSAPVYDSEDVACFVANVVVSGVGKRAGACNKRWLDRNLRLSGFSIVQFWMIRS